MTNRTATLPDAARNARATAADLLWTARTEPAEQALDHVVWALCLVPECRAARMQRIDLLIKAGDYDEARDALAAEAMRRPLAWSIAYRRALVHFHRHGVAEAQAAIRFVLRDRPRHARALRLAAQIARERGQWEEALSLLERARAARPRDVETLVLLAEVSLEAGQFACAAAAIELLDAPPASLASRMLAASGRRIDARLHLEQAIETAADSTEQDELLRTLIDLVDADGGVVAPLRWQIRRSHRRAILGYAAMELSRGRAESALRLARWAARGASDRLEAMVLIAAAASVLSRHELASSAAGTVQALARTPRQMHLAADIWRRAIAGRTFTDIRSGSREDEEPTAGVLEQLLARSVEIIERRLRSPAALARARRAELERHVRFGVSALEAAGSRPASTARRFRHAA